MHEREELVLVKNMVLRITWNNVVSRNIKFLCSQDSLGTIEHFITDEDSKFNGAENIIVTQGIRVFYETGDD